QTGEPLDVALDGDGFLAVETPAGRRYTRDGQLTLDAEGRLRTATGYLVLGDDGRPIRAGSASGLEIAADGTVRSGGRAVGRLGVVSLREPVKQGDTLFAGLPGPRPPCARATSRAPASTRRRRWSGCSSRCGPTSPTSRRSRRSTRRSRRGSRPAGSS